jgi:hypothetical protein
MGITDTGGLEAKDHKGLEWSVQDIKDQAEDILKHQDYDELVRLVRGTRNWRSLRKALLIEMMEMLAAPRPRGRKRVHENRQELKAMACLVRAAQTGLSFSKTWEKYADGARPTKPTIDINEATSILRARDLFDGEFKRYLISKFQIST